MKKRITVEILSSYKFLKVPKELIFNLEKYSKLSTTAILAYSLLFDRLELSAKNGWINDDGEIYIKFKRDIISRLVRVKSKTTISNVFKELKAVELIEERQVGLNMANEIYLLQTEFSENQISDEEILNIDTNISKASETAEIHGSPFFGRPENGLQEVQKMDPNKTNIIKTNIINKKEPPNGGILHEAVIKNYSDCISEKMSALERTVLIELQKAAGYELLIKAILIAAMHNNRNLAYIRTTLKDWIGKGLRTSEEVDGYLAEWSVLNKKAKTNRELKVKKGANSKVLNFRRTKRLTFP
ncbi:replication initiator protein A [Clostridium oryzae]|uniref:Replication initiation and membrane attachment n=1 Tax=Clostridium oryzae TaxID=1450648 RepID=A0A1V4IN16_9CLOT|nr:replication initiator protein A [Clostridium oryzae]OPJ61448.1 hypothetical protein CLORY_23140 [Clostridium oryzae]